MFDFNSASALEPGPHGGPAAGAGAAEAGRQLKARLKEDLLHWCRTGSLHPGCSPGRDVNVTVRDFDVTVRDFDVMVRDSAVILAMQHALGLYGV